MSTLDATGLTIDRLADVRARLEEDLKAAFGPAINLTADGVLGKVSGIVAAEFSSLNEALQQLYDAFDLDNAEGNQLDNLAQLIKLTREAATHSVIVNGVVLTGTPAAVIPLGTLFSRGSGGPQFELDADVIIGGGGTGTGSATAVDTGVTSAAIGELDTIVTPAVGLTSVTNSVAASGGRARETDTELRLRIRASGAVIGSATVEAIRARIRELDAVEEALVVENDTDAIVGGQPPHSIHVIIFPALAGDDLELFITTLFSNKAAGSATHGALSQVHTDSMGIDHTVLYSVAVTVNVAFRVTVTRGADYPDDGDEQIIAEVRAYVNGTDTEPPLSVGQDVSHVALVARLFNNIPGIEDLVLRIGLGPVPPEPAPTLEDPFAIAPTQIARVADAATNVTVDP